MSQHAGFCCRDSDQFKKCLTDGAWEIIDGPVYRTMDRQSVPHGWLVYSSTTYGLATTFVLDEEHEWKAKSDE